MSSREGSWLGRILGRSSRPGRDTEPRQSPSTRTTPRNPFHAVSIAVGRETCRQVEALIGTRFLARDAPKLPLKNCDNPACRCRYVHHDDRRVEDDRRLRDLWRLGKVNAGDDRRRAKGRRAADE